METLGALKVRGDTIGRMEAARNLEQGSYMFRVPVHPLAMYFSLPAPTCSPVVGDLRPQGLPPAPLWLEGILVLIGCILSCPPMGGSLGSPGGEGEYH